MNIRGIVQEAFKEALIEKGSDPPSEMSDEMVLLDSSLDSMGFAVLVIRLENELGYDPFILMSDPFYPRTFGELVHVYEQFQAHASQH